MTDEYNERSVEFLSRIDSMVARLELHPAGTQRDRFLNSLMDARFLCNEYFNGIEVGSAEVMGRMS